MIECTWGVRVILPAPLNLPSVVLKIVLPVFNTGFDYLKRKTKTFREKHVHI